MSLNDIHSSINLDDIKLTSELDPNSSTSEFKAKNIQLASDGNPKDSVPTSNKHTRDIGPTSEIDILTNNCLHAIFNNFSMLEWVFVLRFVCVKWNHLVQLLCFSMFSPLTTDADLNRFKIAVLNKSEHYFFKRIHFVQSISQNYPLVPCLKLFDPTARLFKKDRVSTVLSADLEMYEYYIVAYIRSYFKKDQLKLLLFHASNYLETRIEDKKRKQLMSIAFFGYTTGLSYNFFSETMSHLMESIGRIQSTFKSKINLGILQIPLNDYKIFRINLSNCTQFECIFPFLQQYSVHYTGGCPPKLCSQLCRILEQMSPIKLFENVMNPLARSQPWNEEIDTFRITSMHRDKIVPLVLANCHSIDCLQIESIDQHNFDFIQLLRQITCTGDLGYLLVENVTFHGQTVMHLKQCDPSTICTRKDKMKILIIQSLKLIYPADGAIDAEARFKNYGLLLLNLLAELFPNLKMLEITSSDAQFVRQARLNLQIFPNLIKHKIIYKF